MTVTFIYISNQIIVGISLRNAKMALTKNPITITVGLAVFLFWLNIVGNPHVVETVLGLVIGIAAAISVRKAILNRFLP